MKINWNWGAFFASVQKSVDDFRANTPPVAAQPMTGTELATALEQIEAQLPTAIAYLKAHQGVITASDDILAALQAQGVPYTADIQAAVDAAPAALTQAASWLPTITMVLQATAPAPTYAAQNKARGQV